MFIIWGTKNKESDIAYLGENWQCGHCNNTSHYRVFKRATWFTLFWIPLFPVSVQYFVACPVCNYGKRISKKEMEELFEKHGQLYPH